MQLYGQYILDELVVSELFSNSGWWGNKFAFQLGAKYYGLFVPNLNVQVEYNQARPFTYTHDGDFTSYTHFRQPLAHPLGANFRELLLVANYQPFKRWRFTGDIMIADYGSGPVNGFSVGRDPFINSNNREGDFNNRQGQGIASDLRILRGTASYQLKHNLIFEGQFTYRQEKTVGQEDDNSLVVGLGARWNIPGRNYSF